MEIETVTIKSENLADEFYPENIQIGSKEVPETVNSDKPFRCGVCGHCTTSHVLLKVHMKMHLMKRVHQCNICKKCFSFVTELNNHMRLHTQEKTYQSLLRESYTDDAAQKANPLKETEKPAKQFKNKNPNLPLSEEEKFLLVQFIEKLGLNTKYKEMDNIKTFLRNGWAKMVNLFAEKAFDRNPDKLARTYFHMKNQAKMHVERFYIQKKLPRPRKIDYIFVKLCPSEFEGLGLDLRELHEDSKIYDNDPAFKEDLTTTEEEEKHIDDIGLLPNESMEDNDILSSSKPPTSYKRGHSESETEIIPNKIPRYENENDSLISLKIKCLIEEDKRKQKEHEIELKKKDLEMRYREELHKKEIELKNLEILILTKKIQQNRV